MSTVSAAPEFGQPCPIQASPQTLSLLAHRRSSSAQTLTAPGPNAEQIQDLLRLAARAPDHGKLFPWRFVVLEGAPKDRLVDKLKTLAAQQPGAGKALAVLAKLSLPPVSILVVSAPKPNSKPQWEQELSAGAVCMLMLIAAEAMGFGANWITDWYSYEPQALDLLGMAQNEKVAGFIHLGTPTEPPLERVRPDLSVLTSQPGV